MTESDTNTRQFAFGTCKTADGVGCPAVAYGLDEDDIKGQLRDLTVKYDARADILCSQTKSNYRLAIDTVDEQTAREAWLHAIEECWKSYRECGQTVERYNEQAELGEEIARELGWME